MRGKSWLILVPVGLAIGLAIALVDTSPGWDDTGISAVAVLAASGLLAAIQPRRPWVWALAVGLWTPALNIATHHNYGSLIVLIFAFAGAYMGAFAGKVVRHAGGEA
jgi:hypothetical protein